MPQYKLTYFDMKGLAEPIRLCFAQAGVPFEDVRLKMDEWPQHKEKMPFGQLPVLEVDGKQLTQTISIMRYVARKHGLEADDEWDRTLCDELVTSWLDLFVNTAPGFQEKEKAAKKQKFQKSIDEFIKPRLKITDERLSHSKSGFMAGSKATYADFTVYNILTMIRDWLKVPLDEYKNVHRFVAAIEALPKIKEWHAKHPSAIFTIAPSPMD